MAVEESAQPPYGLLFPYVKKRERQKTVDDLGLGLFPVE
jgi:hypothetical protein